MTTKKFNPLRFFLLMLQGALVGCGAILPGVSGGVLAAAFGIYEPIMDFLAHPIKGFKRHIFMLIPIILGGGIGFVGLAKLVDLLLSANTLVAMALFAGLICGTFPNLARKSVEEKPKRGWIGFVLALFLSFVFFSYIAGSGMHIDPNFGWYIFCGVIWAFSMVIPGLSSSSILLFMGLYHPMDAGIGNLDIWVILPLIIGFVPTILASAKPINFLLSRFYPYFSKTILGFMLSSVLVMMLGDGVRPEKFGLPVIFAVLCFAAGFALAVWMGVMIEKREKADKAAEETANVPASADAVADAVFPAQDEAEAIEITEHTEITHEGDAT